MPEEVSSKLTENEFFTCCYVEPDFSSEEKRITDSQKDQENGKKREKGDLQIQRELRVVESIAVNPLKNQFQRTKNHNI